MPAQPKLDLLEKAKLRLNELVDSKVSVLETINAPLETTTREDIGIAQHGMIGPERVENAFAVVTL